jgi:hypothetical protein
MKERCEKGVKKLGNLFHSLGNKLPIFTKPKCR